MATTEPIFHNKIPGLQKHEIKSSRRKIDEPKTWATLVINNISPGYIEVFNEAWQEFLLAKQAEKVPWNNHIVWSVIE